MLNVGILVGTNFAPLLADLFLFCYQRRGMDVRTDARMDKSKAICPFNFFQSWGHKKQQFLFQLMIYIPENKNQLCCDAYLGSSQYLAVKVKVLIKNTKL